MLAALLPAAGRAAAGTSTSSARRTDLPGVGAAPGRGALAKALKAGLVAWRPKQEETASSSAAAAAAAPASQEAGGAPRRQGAGPSAPAAPSEGGQPAPAAAEPARSPYRGTLVHALVRVLGKGRCEAGAEVCAASSLTPDAAQAGEAGRTATGSGRDHSGGGSALVVVGYVTSPLPRGARGYPGGLAGCDARELWRLRAAQQSTSYAARTASGAGGGRGQGRGEEGAGEGEVVVLIRNPGSSEFRRAVARPLLLD